MKQVGKNKNQVINLVFFVTRFWGARSPDTHVTDRPAKPFEKYFKISIDILSKECYNKSRQQVGQLLAIADPTLAAI